MGITTRRSVLSVAALLQASAVRHAQAQDFPSRPISWVVPFPPGGITDTSSRLVARPLGAFLGQQVIIDNRPGAGGSIGTEMAARSTADGYTILYGTQGTLATNPVLYQNINYDALRDFVPVHGLTETPLLLVTSPERRIRSLAELIARAKAKPGEITYSSSGIGTGTHMAAELFQLEAGVELTHVPYQGSAPALNDLVAGRVDIMFDYLVATRGHIAEVRLRSLVTTGSTRMPGLPDVPTLGELGLAGAETTSWSSIMVPAATPAQVVLRLTAGMQAALSDTKVRETLTSTGSSPLMLAGVPLRQFVERDIARWRAVVERSGAKAG
ncbi:Bug family tripartite tricarboxylate transporter substrate binding protein [Paeniroseomonas aquatica]|uniref:Tripartite tricarboxylate transporter substrate binding protein n=1 Tax=Paeniroseomonas aquatica TaxID=373043 RepID=A0ABT8A0R4_9PROT|nr:tripartite tricarboxylate transporter substrate binding protein [Paeniroseomonas aquatica]MDN3563317.1 tripartite tricarboxylate transporter substrate binding protein [Paeniroseomonas aquatica]